MKHIPPILRQKSFHCPICGVLAEQTWTKSVIGNYLKTQPNRQQVSENFHLSNCSVAKCSHCEDFSIWLNDKMIYPLSGSVEMANPDLPEDIKKDYNEAKDIVNVSPRGSAALLRLAVQKLCLHLGEKGDSINEDIKNLVKKGLPR